MARQGERDLSRRERQIMDILYALGEASAGDVHAALPDAPSYSSVRTFLRILEDKGHLKHRTEGPRYVYAPTRSRRQASRSALQRLLQTFFDGSVSRAMTALLESSRERLTPEELDRLSDLIDEARKEGR